MWSGGTDQWGMNHAMTYMSMPHEQVDWASLAQQWIKMKEEAPEKVEEGGEAPMEITKDEVAPPPVAPRESEWMNPQAVSGDANNANWGTAGWNWDQAGNWMQWAGATAQTPNMATATGYTTMPNSAAGYTTVPNAEVPVIPPVVPPAPMYPYAPAAVPPVPSPADNYTRGYWTGNPPASVNLPPESVKPSRWDTGNSRKKHASAHNAHPVDALPVPELDAAKRRALPAWIREGLEKMEREKQKKAEQERMSKLKKGGSSESIVDDIAEEAMTNGDVPEVPKKSRFDSDSESDDVPAEVKPPVGTTPRRSRFDQSEPAALSQPLKPKFKTKEQILQAVMGDVRRILTQLLMEVTSEEIQKAAEETQKLFKKKAPAATLRKTPALASLTGKLGLGIYESDSEDESEPEKVTNDPDSDQEIQDRIKRLKKDFVRVEENIEREALELEERERNQLVIGKNRGADHEPSQTVVEEQVQPNREGSTADDEETNHRQKASVEAKDVNDKDDIPGDRESEDTRSSSVVEEVRERTKKERRPREKSKDRPSESRRAPKKKSSSEESSKSDSSSDDESSSSSSSSEDDRSRKHKHRHHKHRAKKATRRNRYSLSASPQSRKERTRSRSRDSRIRDSRSRDTRSRSQSRSRHSRHHPRRERSRDSRSRAHQSSRRSSRKYTPERELRKRRRSSSGSSGSVRKYHKSSHRRR